MSTESAAARPSYDVDLYAESVIRAPYDHYRAIRDIAPAVWLPRNGLWAIARHADVRKALADHDKLISGKGVAANDKLNSMANNNLLASDPPLHDALRKVVAAPLTPAGLKRVRGRIMQSAGILVDRLVARRSFDGMRDLAQFLPLSIVSELVGMPEFGRENMLRWAAATFDMFGGENARTEEALPIIRQMRAYCEEEATRDRVRPDGWVAMLFDAADSGLVEHDRVPQLMRDYLGPSLDTTIFATGHLMHQLGRHPGQWEMLREDNSLIAGAINEAVRLESPIRGFTRYAAEDYDVDGTVIPEGERAIILYASANRDERRWEDPERFDITRVSIDHVGFGHGIHACAGAQLARLEIRALLTAMVEKVGRIEVGEPELQINNVLRGFMSLPMRFEAA